MQIDTDQYTRKVDGNTYHGLPDSHDYSKSKAFFGIFPSLYCSGTKKDGKYHTDYCSPWGKQLFDLHRVWRVWGVDLTENNLIGQTPKIVYIGTLATTATAALAVVLGFIAFYSYWGALLTTVVAWIAASTTIATAALSHAFASKLARYLPKLKLTGTGKITAHLGHPYLNLIWVAATFSLSAALLWSFITWRQRNTRLKNVATKHSTVAKRDHKLIPFIGIVHRATGGLLGAKATRHITSYEPLGGGQEMVGLNSRNGSQTDLISRSQPGSRDHSRARSRNHSRTGSRSRADSNERGEILFDRGRIPQTDIAYEAFRHQQVPE